MAPRGVARACAGWLTVATLLLLAPQLHGFGVSRVNNTPITSIINKTYIRPARGSGSGSGNRIDPRPPRGSGRGSGSGSGSDSGSSLIHRTGRPVRALPGTPGAVPGSPLANGATKTRMCPGHQIDDGIWCATEATSCAAAAPRPTGRAAPVKEGIRRDYTPSLLIFQGMALQLQGITLPPF